MFSGEADEEQISWVMELASNEDAEKQVIVFGDLSIVQAGWTLGLSGWVGLLFRSRKALKAIPSADFEETFCEWAEDALYAHLRTEGAALIPRATGCGIEVPISTPVRSHRPRPVVRPLT